MKELLAALAGASLLAGCGASPAGGGGGPAPSPGPMPGGLSGSWILVHDLHPIGAATGSPTVLGGTLRLVQYGTTLSGTYTPTQAPTSVVVTGERSGARFHLRIGPVALSSGMLLDLTDAGAVEPDMRVARGTTRVTGALGGTTLQTTGTFTMTRQSSVGGT